MNFVDANDARAVARREIESGPQHDDPQFRGWRGAVPGEPQLVHDLLGKPGYWLVPVRNQDETVGAVRVLGSGQAAASIAYRQSSNPLALNREEILKRAAEAISSERSETAGDVLLVHDGPPGREAWRVEVKAGERLSRWIFVTPGGVYQRSPRDVRGDTEG